MGDNSIEFLVEGRKVRIDANFPPCLITEEGEVMRVPDASASQQITRLLGTDDWALQFGGKFIIGADLDEIEKSYGRVA